MTEVYARDRADIAEMFYYNFHVKGKDDDYYPMENNIISFGYFLTYNDYEKSIFAASRMRKIFVDAFLRPGTEGEAQSLKTNPDRFFFFAIDRNRIEALEYLFKLTKYFNETILAITVDSFAVYFRRALASGHKEIVSYFFSAFPAESLDLLSKGNVFSSCLDFIQSSKCSADFLEIVLNFGGKQRMVGEMRSPAFAEKLASFINSASSSGLTYLLLSLGFEIPKFNVETFLKARREEEGVAAAIAVVKSGRHPELLASMAAKLPLWSTFLHQCLFNSILKEEFPLDELLAVCGEENIKSSLSPEATMDLFREVMASLEYNDRNSYCTPNIRFSTIVERMMKVLKLANVELSEKMVELSVFRLKSRWKSDLLAAAFARLKAKE